MDLSPFLPDETALLNLMFIISYFYRYFIVNVCNKNSIIYVLVLLRNDSLCVCVCAHVHVCVQCINLLQRIHLTQYSCATVTSRNTNAAEIHLLSLLNKLLEYNIPSNHRFILHWAEFPLKNITHNTSLTVLRHIPLSTRTSLCVCTWERNCWVVRHRDPNTKLLCKRVNA